MQHHPSSTHPDSNSVRIVIAAVQPSFREFLRGQLESEPQVKVVGDACDSQTACSLTRRLKPDILLIEGALNREFSMHCAACKSKGGSDVGVVAIVDAPRIQDIVQAVEFGARGVVLRASLPPVWKAGIQKILAGQYWVEDKSIELLLDAVRGFLVRPEEKPLPEFGLTLREKEIAGKIAAGRSNKEVSEEFSICERTVKHHLTNIFKKMGVSSRLELAVLVRDRHAQNSALHRIPARRAHDRNNSGEKTRLFAVMEP